MVSGGLATPQSPFYAEKGEKKLMSILFSPTRTEHVTKRRNAGDSLTLL